MAIVLRQTKGSPLTFTEVDNNFSELDTTKAAISGTPTDNRIAVWIDGTAIEGDGNFLWTGTELSVNGDILLTGSIISPSGTNADVTINPDGTGNVLLGTLEFNADTTVGAAQDGYVLKYDNATGEIDLTPTDAVLIASGTATNVASLVFTDLVSTYGRYQLVIHDVSPSVDGANLNMQVSTDNGSTFVTTATYNWALMFARIRSTGGSANGNEGVWQDTSMRIMSNMGTAAGEDGAAIIDLYDPTNANHYTRISTRATILSALPETRTSSAAGEYSATTAVDAFRILMSTGNIATVDYSLYGYRQA